MTTCEMGKRNESHRLGSLPDCEACRAYFRGLSDAANAIENLLGEPLLLTGGMKPTQERQTREDIRYGMQKALLRVSDFERTQR
jgi:hypothetical protein